MCGEEGQGRREMLVPSRSPFVARAVRETVCPQTLER